MTVMLDSLCQLHPAKSPEYYNVNYTEKQHRCREELKCCYLKSLIVF